MVTEWKLVCLCEEVHFYLAASIALCPIIFHIKSLNSFEFKMGYNIKLFQKYMMYWNIIWFLYFNSNLLLELCI